MKAEVDKQCTSRCTDDNVKAGCQRQWILEVDLHTSSVGADCAEESEVKTCFDDKKTTASGNYETCKDTKLSKMKEDHEADCIKEEGPKCKGKCEGKCNVEKMNKCLFLTKSEDDPGKMFCKDFWHLLHSSSEVDPVTGNPIVLLSTETSALAPAI